MNPGGTVSSITLLHHAGTIVEQMAQMVANRLDADVVQINVLMAGSAEDIVAYILKRVTPRDEAAALLGSDALACAVVHRRRREKGN